MCVPWTNPDLCTPSDKKPAVMRIEQIETLEQHRPAMLLPAYAKGQLQLC